MRPPPTYTWPATLVPACPDASPGAPDFAVHSDYVDRIIRGGFPESVARAGRRRMRFLDSYVADIINRDVIQLLQIERGPEMRALTRLVAARSGQLLIPGTLGGELGLS